MADAIAWAKKYFIIDSARKRLFFFEIRGISDNRLISIIVHIRNQEVEEIVIIVLRRREILKRILKQRKIKKKRISAFMVGVWTQ